MTVLIAGCGDLGTQAGLGFAEAGHRVVGWRRSAGKLPPSIEGQSVDLTGELPTIPSDTDVVVIALTADGRSEAAYRATYFDGTANLLAALERDGVAPRRIVFVSSTAVYGNDDGAWVDETTSPSPSTPTGAVLRETEQLLAQRAPQSVMLRLSGIYGPGRTRLIDQVRNGSESTGGVPHWTNRIHRDDAAAAIVHIAGLEAPAGAYLGTDDEPALLAEVQAFLAAELGLPLPAGTAREAESGATGKRCSNGLLRASGFEFAYPTYRDGYRAVLQGIGIRHP
ncbi:NAD-dependent epimerase/dehydratase family protein [Arthrobacter sp.]|uniref:NAD-dependent epimerase/dehydratase family protein n=1 Tax=Arthrobacter sp. TaxID=1667 RepID=UPI00281117BB|nr:NAD-dependent epimerase/dehydratase family protein [Arthrobacter sp.]